MAQVWTGQDGITRRHWIARRDDVGIVAWRIDGVESAGRCAEDGIGVAGLCAGQAVAATGRHAGERTAEARGQGTGIWVLPDDAGLAIGVGEGASGPAGVVEIRRDGTAVLVVPDDTGLAIGVGENLAGRGAAGIGRDSGRRALRETGQQPDAEGECGEEGVSYFHRFNRKQPTCPDSWGACEEEPGASAKDTFAPWRAVTRTRRGVG